jgi:hypothetical protein
MLWLKKRDEIALDAVVRASAKAATALILESAAPEGHVFPPTATHFGGNPYFERGDAWPTLPHDGRPYDFVCQVNLSDCPVHPDVPFDLFTVFLCWGALEEEKYPDVEQACIVRTYRNVSADKAVAIARPGSRGSEDYRVRSCTMRTKPFMTYPWSMERFPAIVAAASKFRKPNEAYWASLKRLRSYDKFQSRVGGFPTWVHDNTLEYDDMVFLAQIDYEPDANNCIGDAAPIFIAMSASDPTWIETDVTQSF